MLTDWLYRVCGGHYPSPTESISNSTPCKHHLSYSSRINSKTNGTTSYPQAQFACRSSLRKRYSRIHANFLSRPFSFNVAAARNSKRWAVRFPMLSQSVVNFFLPFLGHGAFRDADPNGTGLQWGNYVAFKVFALYYAAVSSYKHPTLAGMKLVCACLHHSPGCCWSSTMMPFMYVAHSLIE